jgi:hypothetical protein
MRGIFLCCPLSLRERVRVRGYFYKTVKGDVTTVKGDVR